jgi:CRISPR-associated endonuclease/helicase Cas3
VNTKKSAQALFQLVQHKTDAPKTYHLSTNMCPVHRKEILDHILQLLKNKSPVLCISTQLIEAGVDIDFGSVIRFTAGLDSIAQAAGRCNRNGRPEPGRVHVVNPSDEDENLDRLKDIKVGVDITRRLLDEASAGEWEFDGNLLGPKAIERYFDYYFFARQSEMEYPLSANIFGRDDTLLNLLSINSTALGEFGRIHHGSAPNIYLRQSFMSAAKAFKAINAPTRGVIVPYGKEGKKLISELCAAFDVKKQYELLRKAQRYTVNVFPQNLKRLEEQQAVCSIQEGVDILYLDPRYYSQDFGLGLTPTGEMEVLYVGADQK